MVALLAYTLVVLAVFGALAYTVGLAMGKRGEAAHPPRAPDQPILCCSGTS